MPKIGAKFLCLGVLLSSTMAAANQWIYLQLYTRIRAFIRSIRRAKLQFISPVAVMY